MCYLIKLILFRSPNNLELWVWQAVRCCYFTLNHNINIFRYETDIDGRQIFVVLSYVPNQEHDIRTFFNNIFQYFVTSYHLCICGDFNFVFDTYLDTFGGSSDRGTVGSKEEPSGPTHAVLVTRREKRQANADDNSVTKIPPNKYMSGATAVPETSNQFDILGLLSDDNESPGGLQIDMDI